MIGHEFRSRPKWPFFSPARWRLGAYFLLSLSGTGVWLTTKTESGPRNRSFNPANDMPCNALCLRKWDEKWVILRDQEKNETSKPKDLRHRKNTGKRSMVIIRGFRSGWRSPALTPRLFLHGDFISSGQREDHQGKLPFTKDGSGDTYKKIASLSPISSCLKQIFRSTGS